MSLAVFDLAGRLVRPLQDGMLDPGRPEFRWDGVRQDGRPSPAGMYFVRLRTPAGEDRGKVLLTR